MEVFMSELTSATEASETAETAAAPTISPPASKTPPDEVVSAARCAVAEYLRDLGLSDPDLVANESRRIVTQALERLPPEQAITAGTLTEAAIRLTLKRVEHLLAAVTHNSENDSDRLSSIIGARLPSVLARYSQAVKQNQSRAAAVDSLRSEARPVVPPPRPRPMQKQRLNLIPAFFRRSSSGPKPAAAISQPTTTSGARITLALLTFVSTLLATWSFARIIGSDGFGWLDYPMIGLYVVLFVLVAFSFWTATLGLAVLLRRPRREAQASDTTMKTEPLPSTAILMPVYNEDPTNVFANLKAMIQSLQETGKGATFHVFVLSDTTKADVWLEEERAWAKLHAELPATVRLFYRHRTQNTHRKAGNIADFCTRWGEHYKYMVVLDADSVMAGATLVEMVHRMETDDGLGILQAPPRPVNRQSLFARMHQFAACVYSPVFLEGFALWSQCDGNYWGHNAIIRVQPFMEHCDLPILPGDGPLSGEILSHDFVEAALMRRAGWKVCLAHDLEGSYEECPTTVLDYAQRDQRWCQGNMQHVRLLLAEGLHPASRLHLGMGAMSYLASPLWLVFLVLTLMAAFTGEDAFETGQRTPGGLWLFAVTMAMLILPKVWALVALARQPRADKAAHVWDRALGSMLIETIVSMLIAPIMMLLHTQFVVATLLGMKVTWNAQARDDRGVSLRAAFDAHYPHTLFGLVVGALVAWLAPGLLPWLSPILLGLLLSIPLSMLLGSAAVGRQLAQAKLLLIPEEVAPPPVLQAQHEALASVSTARKRIVERPEAFEAATWDPVYYALHVGILRATQTEAHVTSEQWQAVVAALRQDGLAAIEPSLRRAILSDPRAMEALHVYARSHLPPATSLIAA
jgi:membrane glycosyltransferase